jgi:type III pantothenate kinase
MEFDLLLDIGNTRSKWVLTPSSIQRTLSIQQSGVIDNGALLAQIGVQFANLSSANSNLTIKNIFCTCVGNLDFLRTWQAHFPKATLYQLNGDSTIPNFENGYLRPKELGTDRLAGMLGAKELFPGKNILVIASGTATTIDYLQNGTQFIGGWILPGLDLMLNSLGKSTANLPTLEAHHLTNNSAEHGIREQIPYGTSTKDAIEMGVILATVGAINLAIKQCKHLDHVLITGGNAALLATFLGNNMKDVSFFQEPNLILVGINAWRFYLQGEQL